MRPGEPVYRDLLEELGAVEHFSDPAVYDAAYAGRIDDRAFWLALATERGGPVLEIGCGNGRLLLPMAAAGLEVHGVDRSAPMLADLRRKLRARGPEERARVRVSRADMRTMRLRRRFPTVLCTFNTFLHLYDRADAEAFLGRVRAHLAPGGTFWFDASVPRPIDLARDPQRWFRVRAERTADGRRVAVRERFSYAPLEQILYVSQERTPEGGEPVVTLLAHRQWFPAELEALLHHAGLVVETVWEDFERREPGPDPDVLIWGVRRR